MSGRGPGLRAGLLAALSLALLAAVPTPVSAAVTKYERLERYSLELVNCTRTGGWVRRDGTCRAYGSGRFSAYREPLAMHVGVGDEVALPWAIQIARKDYCGHTLAGSSLDRRFERAGYRNDTRGENVGCSYAWTARQMVLKTHLMMQAERSFRGWHWRQMKDPEFRSAGIAVVQVGRRTRIVVDFYGLREPRRDRTSQRLMEHL
jgi:hypothetical protein